MSEEREIHDSVSRLRDAGVEYRRNGAVPAVEAASRVSVDAPLDTRVQWWLAHVAVACDPVSLQEGDPRLSLDQPSDVIEAFTDVTASFPTELTEPLVDAAVRAFNDTGYSDTARAALDLEDVIDELSPVDEDVLEVDAAEAEAEQPGPDDRLDAADKRLDALERSLLDLAESMGVIDSSFDRIKQRLDRIDDILDGPSPVSEADDPSAPPPAPPAVRPLLRLVGDEPDESVSVHPDPLTIHRHVMPGRHSHSVRRPAGASTVGSEPKNWERYAEDKAIFSSKRPGGALLIDCSGSMSWDFDALQRDLRGFPAATVAVYSGSGGRGMLCVIAERGRWGGFDRDEMRGGNEVDIEALQWLATQSRGPRIWVSDGAVTGGTVSRLGATKATRMIERLTQDAKITRADDITSALNLMRHPSQTNAPGLHRPGRNILDRGTFRGLSL